MDRSARSNVCRLKPKLAEIYFYLTKGCNLRCRHCWLSPSHQTEDRVYPELKTENFKTVLEQAIPLGLSKVKLTGGEPLMHTQIKEILSIIAEKDVTLMLETNAVLCDSEIAGRIAKCRRPFTSVSLDAADPSIHETIRGVKGCFESAVSGIKNLVDAGVSVQIIMTIMNSNKTQIEPMIGLAESLGVKSLKFNVMQPAGRGESMHKAGGAPATEEIIKLSSYVETELATKTNIRLVFDHPPAFIPIENIVEGKQFFSLCDVFGALGVISSGHYALCGVGENFPDMIFGDVEKDALKDVWENNAVLNDMRQNLPYNLTGICSDCLLNDLCFGSCIAQNYTLNKNLWVSNWFCQNAADAGLFPEVLLRNAILKEDDEKTRQLIIRRLEALKISNPKFFYLEEKEKESPDWIKALDEIFG